MAFIKDSERDELRNGFLVTSKIKRVWNRQLEIWQAVDELCRKHEINYWAACGTLLGATRHKGFVPWSDRFTLCMMRPEFNRFCDAAGKLAGTEFEVADEIASVCRIYHSQTTLLTEENFIDKRAPKGLFIEIFALDASDDNDTQAGNVINELFTAVSDYTAVIGRALNDEKFFNDWSVIEALINADGDKKSEFFRRYAAGMFDLSRRVNFLHDNRKATQQKDWYRATIHLPFESIELPAPADYERVLTACYGYWYRFAYKPAKHLGVVHSPDIPYKEFLTLIDKETIWQRIASSKQGKEAH